MSSDEANDAAFRERLLSDPRLSPVLSDPARFRAQVLLTEVVETSGAGTEACPSRGHTRLRRHAFRADAEYFYPASTVKLFGAIAACVALRELARAHPGLDKDTPLAFGACPREADETETETENEVTTLRSELAKLFLTSDNRAFNRCFDLCGPSGIRRWTARHLPGEDVRITHRLFDDAGEAGEADAASALPEVWANPAPRRRRRRRLGSNSGETNGRVSFRGRLRKRRLEPPRFLDLPRGLVSVPRTREGRRFRRAGLRKTK